jgi:type VI protein secretion system component VasF
VTQGSRTTESRNHDYEAIRDIMNQIKDRLTMPDRATLAVGLVGHLATMMNRHQAEKLIAQLAEEIERVQDVPPNRRLTDARNAGDQG